LLAGFYPEKHKNIEIISINLIVRKIAIQN